MRRKYFGVVIAAIAAFGPSLAWGGDREIAEQIIQRLNVNRDSGELKDFTLDMKVDQGVVLFRGNVAEKIQRDLVLKSAEGIEGVTQVIDEVLIADPVAATPNAEIAQAGGPELPSAAADGTVVPAAAIEPDASADQSPASADQTLSEVMAAHSAGQAVEAAGPATEEIATSEIQPATTDAGPASIIEPIPGQIQPAAASEPASDEQVVMQVVEALKGAKQNGILRGFGVDVKSSNGVLQLTGRASSPSQRDQIIRIAQSIPGVAGIREAISVPSVARGLPRLPEPPALQKAPLVRSQAPPALRGPQPPQAMPRGNTPAMAAAAPMAPPVNSAPYRMPPNGQMPAAAAGYGATPVAGQPVPMAPAAPVGAPRYDSPNLPNYAWPGYAAYPNYAALTYPQQYSPTAWPYIGPFYPYPQVPLGWRKVSLEWDDGWWMLDFTDR